MSPAGERVDVRAGQVGAVVDARGAQLDGQRHPRAGAELVAVHPQAQARRAAGLEDGAGLVAVERVRAARLAEHVDPSRVRGAGGEHRAGDQREVLVARRAGRNDVRPEERRLGRHLRGQAERALLVRDGQPVPALDLDGRGALGAQLGDPGAEQRAQRGVVRGPGGGDGRGDPAPVVALAAHPGGELGRPVAGEDQVGVRVDEARDHGAAAEVDPPVRGRGQRGRADPRDRLRPRRRPPRRGACRARGRAW